MHKNLKRSLFFLRVSVFFVMIMWSLSKLLDPFAAAGIFDRFYHIDGIGVGSMFTVALVQICIEILFLLGVAKFWTYGFVMITHAVSTLASWQQYLSPFDHMLFLTALPMLAACVALFLLRDEDTLFSLCRPLFAGVSQGSGARS